MNGNVPRPGCLRELHGRSFQLTVHASMKEVKLKWTWNEIEFLTVFFLSSSDCRCHKQCKPHSHAASGTQTSDFSLLPGGRRRRQSTENKIIEKRITHPNRNVQWHRSSMSNATVDYTVFINSMSRVCMFDLMEIIFDDCVSVQTTIYILVLTLNRIFVLHINLM